jgi:hypothetical protein
MCQLRVNALFMCTPIGTYQYMDIHIHIYVVKAKPQQPQL